MADISQFGTNYSRPTPYATPKPPGAPAVAPPAPMGLGQYAINQAIPGLSGLTQSATGIIDSALRGLPSPSESRLQNAYFGAGSGLDPGSDFLRNRGFDLYKRDANARQQQGFNNLLGLVQGYSGTVAPTPGQELQDRQQSAQLAQSESQFGRNLDLQNAQLGQQANQFNQNFGFEQEQWKKQLQLLDQYLNPAGGTGTGAGYGNVGGGNAMDYSRYTQQYVPWNSPQGTGGFGSARTADGFSLANQYNNWGLPQTSFSLGGGQPRQNYGYI